MTGTALVVRPPLTPPDCDLRDFGHMPLDVRKFRDSDLVAVEEPEAIVAAIMLWGAAWHQVPAASLPDDDRVLANLAGYGIRSSGLKAWKAIRAGALRGFIKCSDGRLYHPLVAEKAKAAWDGKLKQRWRTFCATIRKHNERNPEQKLDAPEFENWLTLDRPDRVADLRGKTASAGPLFDSQQDDIVACDIADPSHATTGVGHADEQRDMASKGKGERKGEGEGEGDSNIPINDSAEDLLALTARIAAAGGVSVIQPTRLARAMGVVKSWRADAIPVELVLDVIAKRLKDIPERETVSSLAYFDAPIRKRHALSPSRQSKEPATPPPVLNVTDDDDPRVEQIREQLRMTLGPRTYDGWLGPKVAALSLNGSSVTVTSPSPFMADWVRNHFAGQLRDASGLDDVRFKVSA